MNKAKLTEGKILPKLLLFALPLVIGTLFQLTYNLFDFIVLGWFGEDKILSQAAISAAGPITSIFTTLLIGLCAGAGIHTSELFGKEDSTKELRKQIISFTLVGLILTTIITILFICFLNPILTMSNINDEPLKGEVYTYLIIVAIGFIATFIYNNYASVLRSMGDSMASLIFLIVSCLLNVGLNLLFVIALKLEVKGVAIATTISQIISAIAILIYAKIRYKDILYFKKEDFKIDFTLVKISMKYAIASALQQVVLFVGKYLISIKMNSYDTLTIDSFGLVSKIDDFVFSPAQNFAHATAIFIATNKGAKNIARAKKGFLIGFLINIVYGILISLVLLVSKEGLLNLFISTDESIADEKQEIITKGISYLNIMIAIYILPCITNSIQAYFRGIGKLNIVFYSTTVQIIFRVTFAYLIIYLTNEPLTGAAYATLIGWIAMITFELPFLIYYYKTNKNLLIK